jgi:hypothetical protein
VLDGHIFSPSLSQLILVSVTPVSKLTNQLINPVNGAVFFSRIHEFPEEGSRTRFRNVAFFVVNSATG